LFFFFIFCNALNSLFAPSKNKKINGRFRKERKRKKKRNERNHKKKLKKRLKKIANKNAGNNVNNNNGDFLTVFEFLFFGFFFCGIFFHMHVVFIGCVEWVPRPVFVQDCCDFLQSLFFFVFVFLSGFLPNVYCLLFSCPRRTYKFQIIYGIYK